VGVTLRLVPSPGNSSAAHADSVPPEPRTDPRTTIVQVPVAGDDLLDINRRVQALEAASASAAKEPPPPAARPSPEDERANVARVEADFMSRMAAEGVDPKWAGGARASVERDLTALAENQNFTVRAVECKTTICSADLEWPESTTTKPSAKALAMQRYEIGCAHFAGISVPEGASKTYTAKVFFDCEKTRAEAN